MSDASLPKQTQPKDRETDSFDRDLHKNPNAGINDDAINNAPTLDAPSAYDITELHNELKDFTDDELRRIQVLRPGTRLKQGATYIDLRAPSRQEFTAEDGNIEAGEHNWFVPKSQTDYVLWNRLIGVDNPERLDQANEAGQ